MAYIGAPFQHDIFVSYSHGADAEGKPYLKDWSGAFVRELERELRVDQSYRDTLSIFLDQDHRPDRGVDPMQPLTELLMENIGKSGVLLALMSPDYQDSSWCEKERDWWFAKQLELRLPNAGRVAIVKISPTIDQWPTAFADSAGQPLVGFPFWFGEGRSARPLGWNHAPGPFATDFREALLGIAGRLYVCLDELKARCDSLRATQEEASRLAQASGQTIYLHGRAAHTAAWESAATTLQDSGFAVIPSEPDPVVRDPERLETIRERRVEMLRECDALLLVGTDDGLAIDADLVVVGKHDRHSARARSNRLLPCGLLDTVGNTIGTPVRRNNARILQTDWIDATNSPWAPSVQQWLAAKSTQVGAS